MDKEYLFHYTSLESLALILQSQTIKFNSLLKVDDIEEVLCQDISCCGKYGFVSSWTEEEEESIPMWNMYSKLSGVRIKMRKNPFIQYEWDDPLYVGQKVKSYLSLEQIYQYDMVPFFEPSTEILFKVIYTSRADLLRPEMKKEVATGYHIAYEKIGKYKSLAWKFQKEWRYIICIRPVRLSDFLKSIEKGKQIYKYNIVNNIDLPMTELFVKINPEFLKNIEILCGPKMSKGEKILLQCLMDKYCPDGIIRDSKLMLQ